MAIIRLAFELRDADIVTAIATAIPPDGIKVGQPRTVIKADASELGGVYVQVAIEFLHAFKDLSIGCLSAWIYDFCKKRGNKKCRVNGQYLVLDERNIRRLIREELEKQKARKKQRRKDKHPTPKKRP